MVYECIEHWFAYNCRELRAEKRKLTKQGYSVKVEKEPGGEYKLTAEKAIAKDST